MMKGLLEALSERLEANEDALNADSVAAIRDIAQTARSNHSRPDLLRCGPMVSMILGALREQLPEWREPVTLPDGLNDLDPTGLLARLVIDASIQDGLWVIEHHALGALRREHGFENLDTTNLSDEELDRRLSNLGPRAFKKASATASVLRAARRIRVWHEDGDDSAALSQAIALLSHAPCDAVIAGLMVHDGGARGRAEAVRSRREEAGDAAARLLKDVKVYRGKHPRAGRPAIAKALLPEHGGEIEYSTPAADSKAVEALRKKIERVERVARKARK